MKSVITGVLALALLASTAPAALAQDRPDRQTEGGGRAQPEGRNAEHKGEPQHPATPQGAAQPAPHAAPSAPAGPPPGQSAPPPTRGYFRQGDGNRGPSDSRGRGAGQTIAPLPGVPPINQGQYRDGRPDNRYVGSRDSGQPGVRDERYRQDDRYRQDQGARGDQGRRYDDRGRGPDNRGYSQARPPGQDWQRDRPRYDRRDYPFQFSGHQRYRGYSYYPPRGFYARHWVFGDIVPRSWWGLDYRINDWWAYSLPIPPIGYEWVRVGDDALLLDLYSGRVVEVAYDIFY